MQEKLNKTRQSSLLIRLFFNRLNRLTNSSLGESIMLLDHKLRCAVIIHDNIHQLDSVDRLELLDSLADELERRLNRYRNKNRWARLRYLYRVVTRD